MGSADYLTHLMPRVQLYRHEWVLVELTGFIFGFCAFPECAFSAEGFFYPPGARRNGEELDGRNHPAASNGLAKVR